MCVTTRCRPGGKAKAEKRRHRFSVQTWTNRRPRLTASTGACKTDLPLKNPVRCPHFETEPQTYRTASAFCSIPHDVMRDAKERQVREGGTGDDSRIQPLLEVDQPPGQLCGPLDLPVRELPVGGFVLQVEDFLWLRACVCPPPGPKIEIKFRIRIRIRIVPDDVEGGGDGDGNENEKQGLKNVRDPVRGRSERERVRKRRNARHRDRERTGSTSSS